MDEWCNWLLEKVMEKKFKGQSSKLKVQSNTNHQP